jgi:enamine deaminase RidA (YjgF/YER057c/UK114 family)
MHESDFLITGGIGSMHSSEDIRDILRTEGANPSNVVEATTFLVSMNDFGGYNEVYGQ